MFRGLTKSGMPSRGWMASLGTVIFLAGCSSRASSPQLGLRGGIPVRGINEAGWVQLRQEHRGHILLVNFWATWCGPCREEFPGLVQLDHLYRARGLAVIGISMDSPAALPAVQKYLQSQGAGFPSYLYAFRDFATVIDTIDPRWSGGIPATFVYDREGRLVRSWEGATPYEEFERVVRPLLD